MTTINVTPKGLSAAMLRRAKGDRKAVERAGVEAAHRLRARVVEVVDTLLITDRGLYKRGLVVRRTAEGVTLEATAAHSGIVERGCRPHKVGQAVRDQLARWAVRKLGLTKKEAIAAAGAIAHKIETEGMEGRYVMRDTMPEAADFYREALVRMLSREEGKAG